MVEKLAKKNQSVERVFQIIEVMSENKRAMRLQDISQKLNMSSSTVLRFLNTLMVYNYVNQDPETLKYSLTLKFSHIGSMVSSQIDIRDIARPYLVELSEKCHESSCLAIEEDMTVVYIDVAEGPDNMLRTMLRIGKKAPMYCTGVGKLMLLNYDEKKIDMYISKNGLPSLTPNTITTKGALLTELSNIRRTGYSLDNEECEVGAACIAVPIRDYTNKIVACMSVTGPTSRMTKENLNIFKDYLFEAANLVSSKLAYKNKE